MKMQALTEGGKESQRCLVCCHGSGEVNRPKPWVASAIWFVKLHAVGWGELSRFNFQSGGILSVGTITAFYTQPVFLQTSTMFHPSPKQLRIPSWEIRKVAILNIYAPVSIPSPVLRHPSPETSSKNRIQHSNFGCTAGLPKDIVIKSWCSVS